jgi:hypothetical protein
VYDHGDVRRVWGKGRRGVYTDSTWEERMIVGRMMRIAGMAAVLIAVVAGSARAEKTFESKLGSDAAKLADDVKISMMNGDNGGREDGRGLVPYYKALGAPPKRVALISFYVWDCGLF